MHTIFKFPSI